MLPPNDALHYDLQHECAEKIGGAFSQRLPLADLVERCQKIKDHSPY